MSKCLETGKPRLSNYTMWDARMSMKIVFVDKRLVTAGQKIAEKAVRQFVEQKKVQEIAEKAVKQVVKQK